MQVLNVRLFFISCATLDLCVSTVGFTPFIGVDLDAVKTSNLSCNDFNVGLFLFNYL